MNTIERYQKEHEKAQKRFEAKVYKLIYKSVLDLGFDAEIYGTKELADKAATKVVLYASGVLDEVGDNLNVSCLEKLEALCAHT